MTTYNTIFTALRCPDTASSIDTPQSKGEWQRFFGMMDTLERAKIVHFNKGRYELHPVQHKRIAQFAEAVLDSMSKSLELPALESDVCPKCQGKGRVVIDDVPGFWGRYLCLECYGSGKTKKTYAFNIEPEPVQAAIVPSRETFPPVSLAALHATQVLLPAAIAEPITMDASPDDDELPSLRESIEKWIANGAIPNVNPNECPKCGGYGFIIDTSDGETMRTPNCPVCHGSGEVNNTSVGDYPTVAEWQAAMAVMAIEEFPAVEDDGELLYGHTRHLDTRELPVVKLDVMAASIVPALSAPALTVVDAAESLESLSISLADSPSDEKVLDFAAQIAAELEDIKRYETSLALLESSSDEETRRAIRKEPVLLKVYPRDSRFVRVDWSQRGLSSGSFELRSIIRQYERTWWVVTIWHVDKEGNPYPYDFHVAPDTVACEMVDAPKMKSVIPRVNKLLEGLPIAQAVANYGVEDTKAALNEVAKRVIEQALNQETNPQLLPEGV
jgi:hypothetical protein